MKIFVTGSEGYIGTLLGPFLRQPGHDIMGLDTGFYCPKKGTLRDMHYQVFPHRDVDA